MAEDRHWHDELSRLVARGNMAEFSGHTSDLAQVRVIRHDGWVEETLQQYNPLPDYVKRGLTSYIDDINHYIETTPATALPPEFRDVKPKQWNVFDSLKVQQWMESIFSVEIQLLHIH